MSIAFLFPGQGAQTPGFLHRLPDHPQVAQTLEEAGRTLGQDVLELDRSAALQSTVAVQLATVIAGVAVSRALRAEGVLPCGVAGFSVGTFTAAVAAGCLELGPALALVRLRAEIMEKAFPHGYGMAALSGLPEPAVARLVAEIHTLEGPLFLANVNAPTEIVVTGAATALESAMQRAREFGARQARMLAVAVPSHCPLLNPAAELLTAELARTEVKPPGLVLIGNRRTRVLRDADAVREELATNLAHPVRWHDMTTLLHELGARFFVERRRAMC